MIIIRNFEKLVDIFDQYYANQFTNNNFLTDQTFAINTEVKIATLEIKLTATNMGKLKNASY